MLRSFALQACLFAVLRALAAYLRRQAAPAVPAALAAAAAATDRLRGGRAVSEDEPSFGETIWRVATVHVPPVNIADAQRFSLPDRQKRQYPQVRASRGIPARSLTANPGSSSPVASITPTISWTGVISAERCNRAPSAR